MIMPGEKHEVLAEPPVDALVVPNERPDAVRGFIPVLGKMRAPVRQGLLVYVARPALLRSRHRSRSAPAPWITRSAPRQPRTAKMLQSDLRRNPDCTSRLCRLAGPESLVAALSRHGALRLQVFENHVQNAHRFPAAGL